MRRSHMTFSHWFHPKAVLRANILLNRGFHRNSLGISIFSTKECLQKSGRESSHREDLASGKGWIRPKDRCTCLLFFPSEKGKTVGRWIYFPGWEYTDHCEADGHDSICDVCARGCHLGHDLVPLGRQALECLLFSCTPKL